MDLHKLASLLMRDHSIIAKRHYDLARDNSAMAATWRRILDDTGPYVLKEHSTQEDGMPGAPAVSPPQGSWSFFDEQGEEVQ